MPLRPVDIAWDGPPGGDCRPDDARVTAWVPYGDPRIGTLVGGGVYGAGRHGPEVRAVTSFAANLSLPVPAPAYTYECWLVVLGSTITTQTGNSLFLAGSALTGNGVGLNTTTIRIRSSSTYIIAPNVAPLPHEVFFVQLRSGDFRLYQRGAKYTSTTGGTTDAVQQGLSLAGMSLAMAARFSNYTPSDDEIWSLIADPWQLFEGRRLWVPSAGAVEAASLCLSGGALVHKVAGGGGARVYLTGAGGLRAGGSAAPGDRLVRLVGGQLVAQ